MAQSPTGLVSPADISDHNLQKLETAASGSKQSLPFFSRAYILGPVKKSHGDIALLACCLVTGMVDAASFSNWGAFVGMQTGNTVILGLSTAGLPANPHAWLTTLVSIGSFLFGCFCTFHLARVFASNDAYSNRLVVVSLFLVQSLLIFLSAALATPTGLIPQNPGATSRTTHAPPNVILNVRIASLLPPLAFQSGMQITSSRLLGYNEIPVNVLTSTYCDLMGDFQLFALNNVKRNRRAAAIILVLTGAVSSGWLMRSSGGLMSVLWIAGGIKFFTATAILLFMPAAELVKSLSRNQ